MLLDQQVPAGVVQAMQWMGQGEQLTESGQGEEKTTANPWLPQILLLGRAGITQSQ